MPLILASTSARLLQNALHPKYIFQSRLIDAGTQNPPMYWKAAGQALMLKRDADQPLTGRITRFKKARFRIGCERALISRLSLINHHAVPRILFVKRLCNSLCLLLRWLAMPSYQE